MEGGDDYGTAEGSHMLSMFLIFTYSRLYYSNISDGDRDAILYVGKGKGRAIDDTLAAEDTSILELADLLDNPDQYRVIGPSHGPEVSDLPNA
jgi:hypothetical protein